MIRAMASDLHFSEAFPSFDYTTGPATPGYVSPTTIVMRMLDPRISKKSASKMPSIRVPAQVSNFVHLKYYQYEVTFGLYMLTFPEKLILNTIFLTILSALLYGFCFSLQPFLIRTVCHLIWYLYGSYDGVEDVCTSAVC